MGLWSSICSVVSSACNFISSAASSIGNRLVESATRIASLGVSLAAKVTDAIRGVGVSLGIIRPEDNLEELGEKAILSEKKTRRF